jgi:hypothetical protein
MWYRTDTSDCVKIPIKSEKAQTELITGERAETLILYPIRKWDYAEPLLELLIELKKKLEKAKFVIVVGYSFRDDHMRRIFWDAARKNRDMILILIGPNSHQIYHERLKHYEIPGIEHAFSSDFVTENFDAAFPSELSGRTICLPYKFEDVFPYFKNHFLKYLKEGLVQEKEEKRKEVMGESASWVIALGKFIDCNYMEKVEKILPKIEPTVFYDFSRAIEWSVKCIVNHAGLENYDKAKEWFERLWSLLTKSTLHVDFAPDRIEVGFKIGESIHQSFQNISNQIKEAFNTVRLLCTITAEDRLEKVRPSIESLKTLEKYLQLWTDRGIEISRYISLRKQDYPAQIEEFKSEYELKHQGQYSAKREERLKAIVEEIEKKEIEKIFNINIPS